ncbi:PIN domain-containing protein [Paenibacillus sp. FSL R10-2791]|uniref:PIN domain-containing protein n=1 Tax=Paenibacillus sp. FSL R10-2791 TaxID=2954695 RepID=UPI0030F51A86
MHKLDDLVDMIMGKEKSILFLDTCCVLDIIRVFIRGHVPNLHAAVEIIEAAIPEYYIVFPSLINKEYRDNIDLVIHEVKKQIKKSHEFSKAFFEVIDFMKLQKVVIPSFESYKIEELLLTISDNILQKGFMLINEDLYAANVLGRVVHNIPPSKQGKDSTKDCMIFEEILGLGDKLRSRGFDKSIVFASSNTQEYENESILSELNSRSIQYATSLHHGLFLVK